MQTIQVENLSKRFGSYLAVDQLSFTVAEGEVLGFLGPNGAGKSTTMKMLTGFLEPSEGSIRVCGIDLARDPIGVKANIGYLPEGAPAYGEMCVDEFLKFLSEVRRLDKKTFKESFYNVVERLELHNVLKQPVETLSKGFKRRVGLAQALIHDPKVLIMDEPTDGLDPNQKHQVRRLITSLTRDKIVIISTHILEEVSAVCTRALIISEGQLLIDDTPAHLLARSEYHNAVSLQTQENQDNEQRNSMVEALKSIAGARHVQQEKNGIITVFPKDKKTSLHSEVQQVLRNNHWEVNWIQIEPGRLDEVFRTLTKGRVQ